MSEEKSLLFQIEYTDFASFSKVKGNWIPFDLKAKKVPLTDLDFLLEDSKRCLNIKFDLKRLFQKEICKTVNNINKKKSEENKVDGQ